MEPLLELCGLLMIGLALLHLISPTYFHWKEELARISLINRQIMIVHTFFIALTGFLMGQTTSAAPRGETDSPRVRCVRGHPAGDSMRCWLFPRTLEGQAAGDHRSSVIPPPPAHSDNRIPQDHPGLKECPPRQLPYEQVNCTVPRRRVQAPPIRYLLLLRSWSG